MTEDAAFAELATDLSAETRASSDLKEKHNTDHAGPNEPKNAEVGESWFNPTDSKTRWLHGNGRWYLKEPKPEEFMAKNDAPKTEPEVEAETEAAQPDYVFNPRDLMPDIRDRFLQMFKDRSTPWHKMAEEEQRDVAAAVENLATDAIRAVGETIASRGETAVRCQLLSYTEKDGIKVALEVVAFDPEDSKAAVLALHDARGKHVMLTKCSVEDYMGDREAETDPDEPEIDFDAEPDPALLSDGDDSDLAGEEAETEAAED